tara:strand:- start:279 stop:1793 length:1515 start_codon:yes stop_codon:yes gene_type:complete
MGVVVEVKYFNSFLLKKTMTNSPTVAPVWNGSFGIPQTIGGFKVYSTTTPDNVNNWIIEEARIRGGYNNTSVDFGVKAYIVENEPNSSVRINTLIFSGIFNSRTGVNDTNVFSVGQDITKSADPANGSIQKLYAEDANLVIFQENKISRALVNKSAIYSAEGNATVTSSNLTIGVIQPFPGQYGISRNPESFAVYGYDKYFSDENNNVMLKLSGGSVREISGEGMTDYFRDNLNSINQSVAPGFVQGGWDIHNKQYVVSLYQDPIQFPASTFSTLAYGQSIGGGAGWSTFYSFKPDQMLSLRDKLYTLKNGALWQHYSTSALRGNFYGVSTPSSITFVFNPQPNFSKTFRTISYEGSSGWQVSNIITDSTGEDLLNAVTYQETQDETVNSSYDSSEPTIIAPAVLPPSVYSYQQGQYDLLGNEYPAALTAPILRAGFDRKENKYVANLINNSVASLGEIVFGSQMSGIKGFYSTVTLSTDNTTNVGGEKELFNVGTVYSINNGY